MRFPIPVVFLSFLAACTVPGAAPHAAGEVDVLVATKDIPKDEKLDASMVEIHRIPAAFAQPRALRRPEDILGQIAAVTVFQGTVLTAPMVASLDDAGTAFRIPKGYRGYTIQMKDGSALGDVRVGNFVDVLAIRPGPDGKGTDVETILQSIYVLGVGHDSGQGPQTITLMLFPEDVQQVVLRERTGSLRISLRSLWEGNQPERLSVASDPPRAQRPVPAYDRFPKVYDPRPDATPR